MKINVLTLFPEMFGPVTEQSILGRASERGLISVNLINIRDFTQDKHKKTDETPYGGGCGMVMTPQPIFDAMKSIGRDPASPVIYMSPRGEILDRAIMEELREWEEITILCGHYEGVDQRVLDYWNMKEISIGDYVLTGGELPAMVLIDSLARFIPGVLGNEGSVENESVYSGLLEAPQYTKPREYEGLEVPEVLLSGDHKNINIWRLTESMKLTASVRPEMFKAWLESSPDLKEFTKAERKKLIKLAENLIQE